MRAMDSSADRHEILVRRDAALLICCARCGGMRIQGAVGSDDPRFGRRELPAAVDHLAFGAHPWRLVRLDGAHQVDPEFGCGVGPPHRHHGVDSATQGRVQKGGVPATVDGAHWVQVPGPG